MKFLCLLFALYVVLLSAQPCCADRDCEEKSSTEKQCPGCSPLFACGSCVGFVLMIPITDALDFIFENPVRSYAPYRQSDFQEIIPAIWQPPQLN